MSPRYQAGHFDGCLDLEPQSMDDEYAMGWFAGHEAREGYMVSS